MKDIIPLASVGCIAGKPDPVRECGVTKENACMRANKRFCSVKCGSALPPSGGNNESNMVMNPVDQTTSPSPEREGDRKHGSQKSQTPIEQAKAYGADIVAIGTGT